MLLTNIGNKKKCKKGKEERCFYFFLINKLLSNLKRERKKKMVMAPNGYVVSVMKKRLN